MRFAAYEYRNRRQVAVVEEDGTLYSLPGVDSLTDLLAQGGGLPELLDAGSAALDVPAGPHVSDVRLLAPLQPPTVRDFVTFEGHVEHIIGYTVLNDWSARDLQSAEMRVGLGPCKGKDTATTLGPYLVTADELEKYRDEDGFLRLGLTALVNGEQVGTDLLSNMSWTFEEMAAYASRGTLVRPGDVLGSGTCGNGGCLAELWGVRGEQSPPPLKPGDTVTLTVDGIGSVSNTVVAGPAPVTVPVARRRARERP